MAISGGLAVHFDFGRRVCLIVARGESCGGGCRLRRPGLAGLSTGGESRGLDRLRGLLLCAALLAWLGLSSGFADRMSTLFDERIAADSRWMNWQTAWRAICDFPVLGTGFGTYRYAYRPYQTRDVKLWLYNADNHYVEGLTIRDPPSPRTGTGSARTCCTAWPIWRFAKPNSKRWPH